MCLIDSCYLKSNMDRFIDRLYLCIAFVYIDLKSNMDRFIALIYRFRMYTLNI